MVFMCWIANEREEKCLMLLLKYLLQLYSILRLQAERTAVLQQFTTKRGLSTRGSPCPRGAAFRCSTIAKTSCALRMSSWSLMITIKPSLNLYNISQKACSEVFNAKKDSTPVVVKVHCTSYLYQCCIISVDRFLPLKNQLLHIPVW